MSLHPVIYIVLGIIVALASIFQPQMILFVFIGAGMAIYGGFKAFFSKKSVTKQPKRPSSHSHLHSHHTTHHNIHHRSDEQQIQHHHAKHHHHYRQSQQHSQHSHNHQQSDQHVRPQVKYKTCPSCKHAMHSGYRFCPHCGYGV